MKASPRRVRQSFGRTHLYVIVLLLAWTSPLFAAGGDLDTTFDPGTGANSDVRAIAIQADGKIIIGGAFTTYNGIGRSRIARLSPGGGLDGTFNFLGMGTNDTVYAIALQADGKIIIGGAFTTYHGTSRNGIARLHPDGSLDTTFDPGTGAVGGDVRGIAIQADNKIIIGGLFTSYNGTGRNRIARLNPDGSLDTTFAPGTGASGSVFAVAMQSDGKVIIGGLFSSYNGTARSRIARLNPNGSLDTTFDPGSGADGSVFAVAAQLDGRIIIGGLFTFYNGVSRNGIARLNSNGSLDTMFDPGTGAANVFAIAVQSDGKVIIGGFFTTYNGVARSGIARTNTNGSLDTSFDPGTGVTAASFVYAVAVQTDGKILIGGSFTSYNGVTRNRIARLLPAPGALSFSASTNSVNEGAGNATITMTRTGGTDNSVTAKVTLTDGTTSPADYIFAPGALDTSFDPATGADLEVRTVALQPDGKILIGGQFTTYNGVARSGIARVNADGSLDTTFAPGTGITGGQQRRVYAIAVQSDGKIVIGGDFDTYNGVARSRIARLNADGSLDTTFNPGTGFGVNSIVYGIAMQSDKIVIVAISSTYNGVPRRGVARINADGSLDTTFDPGSGTNALVLAVAIQADGKILIGGPFTDYNGAARIRMARLNPNGSLDTTFDPGMGASNDVRAIAVQADGKILIGGEFATYNGVARSRIARVNANGSLDTTFDPGTGANDDVRAIAIQADGKIVIGGGFTTYNGTARESIARLNADGSLDNAFDPGEGAGSGSVYAVALHPDGKIIIGGSFNTYNDVARNGIARVKGDLFVNWPAGDLADKSIQLPIVDDSIPEGSETLALALTNLIGGATTGANPTQTLTIIDNDAVPTPTPAPTPTPGVTPTPTPAGTPTPTPGATPTATPSASPSPTATPGTLGNISTRLRVLAGDNALIGGMIATGTANKRVIIRAIGPSLIPFGVPGALANPTLDLFQGSTLLFGNDDWGSSTQQAEIAASGLAPSNALEAAIIWTLNPGQNYTAVVRGQSDGTGVGIVEAYDLDQAAASKLGNISTRGFVDVDDNVMIAGLIAGPSNGTSLNILVRALGPTLTGFGVPNALANPTLDLVNSSGTVIRSNDNWRDDPQQQAQIQAAGLAPGNDLEAALVETVAPGAYTAIVRGSGRTTGVGLVEAYNIP